MCRWRIRHWRPRQEARRPPGELLPLGSRISTDTSLMDGDSTCRRTDQCVEIQNGINLVMTHSHDITDDQLNALDPLIPKPRRRRDGRGRPWKSRRSVLNGVLWVLRTGAPWADLPDRYPSFQTCHRRFQQMDSPRNDDEDHDCSRARTHRPRNNRCPRILYRCKFRAS